MKVAFRAIDSSSVSKLQEQKDPKMPWYREANDYKENTWKCGNYMVRQVQPESCRQVGVYTRGKMHPQGRDYPSCVDDQKLRT